MSGLYQACWQKKLCEENNIFSFKLRFLIKLEFIFVANEALSTKWIGKIKIQKTQICLLNFLFQPDIPQFPFIIYLTKFLSLKY